MASKADAVSLEDDCCEDIEVVPTAKGIPPDPQDEPVICCICLDNVSKGCKTDSCTHQCMF